jgi:hypothetical protein
MRRLQLYIGAERVDLFKDETVSLTQTIKNVKDISKVFTEFTKTFSVPASSVNNKIFQHYYNSEIVNGFDARIKKNATLELNDLPFKEGTIKLEGVDLKNNVAHTYRITFFGNTVNLKDIFGKEELSSLDFNDTFNEDYSYQEVVDNMQNTAFAQMVVPLITHTDRMFYDSSGNNHIYTNVYPHQNNGIYWSQFKYAVRVVNILAAIETKYDIQFSEDFFDVYNPNGLVTLYMWLHRKSGSVERPKQIERIYTLLQDLYTTNNNLNVSSATNGAIYIYATPNRTVGRMVINITPLNTTDVWGLQVLRDGVVISQTLDQQGQHSFTIPAGQDGILNNAVYTFQFTSNINVSFPTNQINIVIHSTFYTSNQVDNWLNANNFQTNQNLEFNISEQMPKMKVIDFLSGLFKMYNLIAYVENDIIVIKSLDDYYAASTNVYNIDEYLDTTKSTTDVALPFNQINFSYKGLGTLLAKQFNQLTNTGWGSMGYTLDGDIFDAPNKSYEIELPFEHMMFERLYDQNPNNNYASTKIQWGYSVNENLQSYIGSPLLFYGVIQENATPIRILDPSGSTPIDITTYMVPSNSYRLEPTVNKNNLHFQNELNEYLANEPTGGGLTPISPALQFTDTLFETEYKEYIQGVFDNSMRLKKVTAYLPMKIYYNLKLNDLIEMNQQTYKINSLKTDLTTGKTEFELLNNIIL